MVIEQVTTDEPKSWAETMLAGIADVKKGNARGFFVEVTDGDGVFVTSKNAAEVELMIQDLDAAEKANRDS